MELAALSCDRDNPERGCRDEPLDPRFAQHLRRDLIALADAVDTNCRGYRATQGVVIFAVESDGARHAGLTRHDDVPGSRDADAIAHLDSLGRDRLDDKFGHAASLPCTILEGNA